MLCKSFKDALPPPECSLSWDNSNVGSSRLSVSFRNLLNILGELVDAVHCSWEDVRERDLVNQRTTLIHFFKSFFTSMFLLPQGIPVALV